MGYSTVKKTGSGKLMRRQRNKRHILTKKSPKRKRQLREDVMVDRVDVKRIKQMVPYL